MRRLRKHVRPRSEFCTGVAWPACDQSRPKYEAAHWRYTHTVAHKKPDAAVGCAGRPSRRCDEEKCRYVRGCESSRRGADARAAPHDPCGAYGCSKGARHAARPGVQAMVRAAWKWFDDDALRPP